MGLYERDYGRERTPWDRQENPPSMVIPLVVANVIIFVLQMLFIVDVTDPITGTTVRDSTTGNLLQDCQLYHWFGLTGDTLYKPWLWFRFLTYGFLHDFRSLMHIIFNMIGLFIFGRIMERQIGSREFLRFYLLSIIFGGVIGAANSVVATQFFGSLPSLTIGASGGVIATVILFAFHFPHQKILLMFVLPVKAWIAAIGFVAMDLLGALGITAGMGGSNVAFLVHLSGAAFAALYFRRQWNLSFLEVGAIGEIPQKFRMRARRARLKIHDPDKTIAAEAEEADRILAKIHASGESSLTRSERKLLERYSRRKRTKKTDN